MIRKIYLDFIRDKISKGELRWLCKRCVQYFLIQMSFGLGRPLCGPILGTFVCTYKCNYRCKMCNLPSKDEQLQRQGLKELSTIQLKQLLRDFARLGTSGIGFTGGEPLLRSDIFELLQYTKALGMITHINTNGFFITDEKIKEIFNAHVDSINISLDGACAHTHDTIRGYPGAFEKVIEAVERMNAMRKKTGISIRLKIVSVIDETNIDEVPKLFTLSQDLKTDCIEFIPQQSFFASRESAASHFNEDFFTKVERTTRYLIEMKRQGAGIENSVSHLRLFLDSFKKEESPLVCYAGYNSYAVDCYGLIYPCMPWVNQCKSVGNIENTSLKRFWFSDDYNKTRNDILKCHSCYLNCQAELNLLFNIIRA